MTFYHKTEMKFSSFWRIFSFLPKLLKRVNVLHSIVSILFSDVEVACTNYEGVDAVKRALKKGLELSTETMPIKVNIAVHIGDV